MLVQRMMQQSARRCKSLSRIAIDAHANHHGAVAVARPTTTSFLSRTPQILASQFATSQRRLVDTTPVSLAEANDSILARQRLNRPVSPHLAIYRPQLTWILSMMNRITGSVLSGAFYIFGSAYLIAPLVGWHLESTAMAASVAAWPFALKLFTKFSLALPFTFHSFNGIRHLVWDMGKQITNKQVIQTGWFVTGISVVSALYLALL